MILLKLKGEVMLSKLRIGAEDDNAPTATCGYFNLNHAASTAINKINIKLNKLNYSSISNLDK